MLTWLAWLGPCPAALPEGLAGPAPGRLARYGGSESILLRRTGLGAARRLARAGPLRVIVARPVPGQTGLVRVVVTRIDWDGTMRRRMVDTAQRGDGPQWEELAARAVAILPPYRPVPRVPIYHVSVDDTVVQAAEHDLTGALLDLVTAVLALGEELLPALRAPDTWRRPWRLALPGKPGRAQAGVLIAAGAQARNP